MSDTQTFQETFSASMETFLGRLRSNTQQALQGGALAGTLALASLLGLADCGDPVEPGAGPAIDPEAGLGKADWAQDQGQRNKSMVSYMDMNWHEYTNYNGRFGYQGVDVYIKLKVRPVIGADLSKKHVGVEYHTPDGPSNTAVGNYFTTLSDGTEEWHVRVGLRTSDPHVIVFNAWYQDGKGHTYYDDNNGALYPIAYDGSQAVIQQDWSQTKVQVGPGGVTGTIAMLVADLAYEKDLRIRYTTDDWKTSHEITIGAADKKNALHYTGKVYNGMERWVAEINLPGPVSRLQYALMYRHGLMGGAESFEFWDNAFGQNYVVTAP